MEIFKHSNVKKVSFVITRHILKAMNIIINKTHGSTECRWRGGGRWRRTVEAECSGAHNVCANYSHLLLLYTILTMHFIPKLK